MAAEVIDAPKNHIVSEKNRKALINFAKTYLNWNKQQWKNVLWTDESKLNLWRSDGSVRRPRDEKFNPIVKNGCGNIMVWRCLSGYVISSIHRITDTMSATVNHDILSTVMLPYAECEMSISWTFQHDNDPKHTARLVKTWIEESIVNLMEWPPQSQPISTLLRTCGWI